MKDRNMKAKVLRRPVLVGLALGIVVLCSVVTGSMTSAQTAPIDRSPWRMFITPAPHGPLASGHDDMSQVEPYFADASIPDESDPGWQPAPEPDTIGFDGQVDPNFGGEQASRLTTCGSTVDYTYFETIVTVPPGTNPNTFTVDFVDIDDAAQISIFNSANPTGTVGTDGIVRASTSATQTGNLAGQLVEGPNRVVITQMDFCNPGNTLHEARITLDGSEVPTEDVPDATTTTDGGATTTTSTSARPPRTPIPPPASFGDVHIRTPDALVYDFQAVGDFVLAQTPSGDVMFQSRQDILDIRPRVSINTAAAMNVAGDTLEFYLDPEPRFFVNGVRTDLPSTDLQLPLGGVVEPSITQSAAGPRVTSPNDFTVTWPDGGTAARVLFKRGVHLDLGIAWLSGDQTYEGLLGNLDGDPANDMAVRDGDEISQPASDEELVSFGDSWRVPADASLLQGESPVREAADTADAPLTQDELDPEVVAEAEQICQDAGISDEVALESCVFDVAATGDEGFVDSAATVEAAIEELPASAPEPVFATEQPDAREDDGLPWVPIIGVVAAVLVVVAGVAYSRATKAKRTRATGSSARTGAEPASPAGPNAGTGPTDQSDPIDGG